MLIVALAITQALAIMLCVGTLVARSMLPPLCQSSGSCTIVNEMSS